MTAFDKALVIVGLVVCADSLRHLARWRDRRRAAITAKGFQGHAIDVSAVLPRLDQVRRNHRAQLRDKRKNLRHHFRLIQRAQRVVRGFAWFRSHPDAH